MKIRVEEKSLELAMVKAAGKLGITQSKLCYKILSRNAGFLGLFGKKVCIEAWASLAGGHSGEDGMESTELPDQLKEDLRQFLAQLCAKMCGEKIVVQASLEGERLAFDICDETLANQIAKNPKLAEALEHLLRKKPRHIKSELPFRIFVDANKVRMKKEMELITMAKDLSDKVFENQKPIVLNYQSPYDRKIIHMALDQDRRVYTKSIGVGHNRKLMILPSKEAHA